MNCTTTEELILRPLGLYDDIRGTIVPKGTLCRTVTRADIEDPHVRETLLSTAKSMVDERKKPVVVGLRYLDRIIYQVLSKSQIVEMTVAESNTLSRQQYAEGADDDAIVQKASSFHTVEIMKDWQWYLLDDANSRHQIGTVWRVAELKPGHCYRWWANDGIPYELSYASDTVHICQSLTEAINCIWSAYRAGRSG